MTEPHDPQPPEPQELSADALEERLLEASLEALGRPAQMQALSQDILAAAKASEPSSKKPNKRFGPKRRRPVRATQANYWLPLAAAALVLIALMFVISSHNQRRPQIAKDNPQQEPKPKERPTPKPKDPPAKTPEKPEPPKRPQPETPKKQQPKPPEPKKPEPKPGNEPEPKQPAVKDPKPEPAEDPPVKEPEPKTSQAQELPVLASVISGSRMEIRAGPSAPWRELKPGQALRAKAELRCRKAVDLRWRDGGLVRVQGHIRFSHGQQSSGLEVLGTELYLDRLGLTDTLTVTISGQSYQCPDSLACFSKKRDKVQVLCLKGQIQGQVAAQKLTLKSGQEIEIKKAKASKIKRIRGLKRRFKILKRPCDRALVSESFDELKKAMTKGQVANGCWFTKGASSLEMDLPKDRPVEPGMILRLRLKARKVSKLTLQIWAPELKLNHRVEIKAPKWTRMQWREWPLSDFVQALDQKTQLSVGDVIRNIQLHVEGQSEAELHVDELQLIRRVGF